MKKVVHFEVHFVILYSKTELLNYGGRLFFFQFLSPAKIEGISENFNALSGNNSGFMV